MQGFPVIITDVLGLIWGSWGGVGFVTLQPHPNHDATHGTEVLCCTGQLHDFMLLDVFGLRADRNLTINMV